MGKFTMPSLGSDMEAGTLSEWYVKPGDTVKRGDIIAEVDTQKGLIEIEVFEDGKISELLIQPGEKVPVGTPLAIINGKEPVEEETPMLRKEEVEKIAEKPLQKAPGMVKEESEPVPLKKPVQRIKVTPLARKIAEEKGIDLSLIRGSGEDGIIHRFDVEKIVKEGKPSEKVKPQGEAPKQEVMRQAIAAAMSRSNQEIPHYYLESRINMKNAIGWLEEENKKRSIKERILLPVLLIKAAAKALTDVPQLNGYWKDGQLQIQEAINLGFAISLRQGGLVIPAMLNADLKGLDELMQNLTDITLRSRDGKLRSQELSSSTITVTSLGDRGADKVFGVIYPPQVALVGFGKLNYEPWAENGMLGIAPVITTTLAADHRATDGHTGSLFLEKLNLYLQKPEEL